MRLRLLVRAILPTILLAVMLLAGLPAPEGAGATPPPLLAADADPSGNDASVVGTVDTCLSKPATTLSAAIGVADPTIPVVSTAGFPATGTISIDAEFISYTGTTTTSFTGATRGVLSTTAAGHANGAFVGPRFQIDFIFRNAPPMFGPELDLVYNGTVLQIDSQDASTVTSLVLTKNGNTAISSFTDSGPDSDGLFHIAVFDFNFTGPGGDGAVVRLNVTALAAGTSPLTIASPLMLDVNGNDVTPQFAFANSEIRVGAPCPAVPGHFNTAYSTGLNTTAAGGSGNRRADFGFPSGSRALDVSTAVTFSPPDVTITPGSAIPVGEIVGSLTQTIFLGVLNSDCSNPFVADFTLRNASTDPRDTISAMPEGTFNRMGNLRQDTNADGFPDYLDKYPAFLNELLDPDDSDVTGSNPIFPLRPLARYAGGTNIADTDVIVQFLVFGREALTQFANADSTHPFQQFTDDFGYASVRVFQDPTAAAAPSTITDVCAPFSSATALSAATDPEVSLVTNECANATDDDGDGDVNDGCPRIGNPESTCGIDTSDDGEDTPADDAVNDGCPANGPPESAAVITAQCAGGADDDADGSANDGCPQIGAPETPAQCTGDSTTTLSAAITSSNTTIPVVDTTGFPTAGTIQIDAEIISYTLTDPTNIKGAVTRGDLGTTPAAHAISTEVSEAIDDDLDGRINDGCPTVGSDTLALNPPAGTGLFQTDTHLYLSFNLSHRDADNDGFENSFDTCPFVPNIDDARATAGADQAKSGINLIARPDMIDPACDAAPGSGANSTCGPLPAGAAEGGPADDDNNGDPLGQDCDLDGLLNSQDNCPQVANFGQTESERNVSFDLASPDGGSRTDGIGDACDVGAGAEDDPAACLNIFATANCGTVGACGTDTIDDDGDGAINDGCPADGDPEISMCTGAGDGVDDDSDGTADDGCGFFGDPATVGGDPELQECSNAIDDDGDGKINDGCPIAGGSPTVADGHYHATLHKVAVCFGTDTDGDGWCDATESILGSINGAAAGESTAQCDNNQDDDWDSFVNDGCSANTAGTPEADCAAGEPLPLDDDSDGIVNDGCPANTAGTAEGTAFNSGPCAGNADDDGDGVVNDGCPADGNPETGDQCGNDIDDDSDASGAVNEGCPTALVSVPETLAQCSNSIDDEDNYPETTAFETDGLVNDGCPTALVSVPESGAQCLNATDDEDNYAPAPGIQLDGAVNDGCPGVSTPENIAVDYDLPITSAGATPIAPATSGVAQTCSDGVDNDGDGLTDSADPGCTAMSADVDEDGVPVGDPCATAVAGAAAGSAQTAVATNVFAQSASDLCLVFKNGAGFNTGAVTVNAPGCPAPITVVAGTNGAGENVVKVDWGAANKCVDTDETVTISFDATAAPSGGFWTVWTDTGVPLLNDNCPGVKNPNQKNTDFDLNAAGYKVDDGGGTLVTLPADGLGDACDIDDDNDSWTGNGSLSVGTVSTGGATSGICRSTTDVPVFRDCIEQYLGTDQFDACPLNANDDVWPVDIEPNGTIDVGDAGPGGFVDLRDDQDLRGDFNADLSVNLFDAFLLINTGPLGDTFGGNACSRT